MQHISLAQDFSSPATFDRSVVSAVASVSSSGVVGDLKCRTSGIRSVLITMSQADGASLRSSRMKFSLGPANDLRRVHTDTGPTETALFNTDLP